jgi:hypothetical protein
VRERHTQVLTQLAGAKGGHNDFFGALEFGSPKVPAKDRSPGVESPGKSQKFQRLTHH